MTQPLDTPFTPHHLNPRGAEAEGIPADFDNGVLSARAGLALADDATAWFAAGWYDHAKDHPGLRAWLRRWGHRSGNILPEIAGQDVILMEVKAMPAFRDVVRHRTISGRMSATALLIDADHDTLASQRMLDRQKALKPGPVFPNRDYKELEQRIVASMTDPYAREQALLVAQGLPAKTARQIAKMRGFARMYGTTAIDLETLGASLPPYRRKGPAYPWQKTLNRLHRMQRRRKHQRQWVRSMMADFAEGSTIQREWDRVTASLRNDTTGVLQFRATSPTDPGGDVAADLAAYGAADMRVTEALRPALKP